MKKVLCFILIFAALLSLSACGSAAALPEGFEEAAVLSRAEELIDLINTKDYAAVVSQLRDDLETAIKPEELKTAWGPTLEKAGAFVEVSKTVVSGTKDPSTDEDYAVAILVCKYENASLTYTISVDRNLEIVGMYMK